MRAFPQFIFFLFAFSLSLAQNAEVDSLQNFLRSAKEDTQKVYATNRLAKILEDKDPALSLQYARQAYVLSDKLHFIKGKAMALVYHADFYYFRGNADSAEKKYEEALALFASIKDKSGQAWAYMIAGNNFTNSGQYEKAIRYVLESVKLNEQIGNETGYAWALETAGSVFAQLGVYEKANEYTLKSLAIMQRTGNSDGLAACYNTLGIINDYTGNADKALEYYSKALVIREEKKNIVEVISLKANMGIIYHYAGNHAKAISYLKDALRLARQSGQESSAASTLINLGEAYMSIKNYPLSLSSLKEGVALADTLGMLEYKQEGVRLLAETYFASGDYKNAYRYRQVYGDCKDSVLKTSGARAIFEMNSKYEAEKKDKELLQKDAEISKQQLAGQQRSLQRNSFIAAFALMLGLSFFIFRSYRQTRKINEEVQKQKELIEEKQKEILDSIHYARRIQNALITPEKYIERILKKNIHA